jgi:hypothetical protein
MLRDCRRHDVSRPWLEKSWGNILEGKAALHARIIINKCGIFGSGSYFAFDSVRLV